MEVFRAMELPPGNPSGHDPSAIARSRAANATGTVSKRAWWIALAAILIVTVAIRVRLLNAPLERDEGEYAYGGQLLLQGVPLYREFYTMKWPGTHAAYALIMAVFGESAVGIHAGLTVVSLATALMVFVLARRAAGEVAGVVAAGTYALLSINPAMLGLAAHATHFVALPALGGILLVERLEEHTSRSRILFAGLLLGLAALMKQSGVVFGLFAALWIAWQECVRLPRDRRRLALRLGLLTLGAALPLLATGVAIAAAGAFDHFWLWTVQYARAYASLRTPHDGLLDLRNMIGPFFRTAPALWVLAGLGALLLFYEPSLRHLRIFALGLALFSFIGVCPGWYFRGHYFLLVLPAVGLLAGMAAQAGYSLMARLRGSAQATGLLLLLFSGMVFWTLFQSRAMFFQVPARQIWRSAYTPAFFAESVEVGEYLRSHCPATARIVVFGSEPQIYFYSQRRSATGHIYMYPLMEPQPYALAMQQEMIREIESSNPEYFVWVLDKYSWLQRKDSPVLILDWLQNYGREHLELVAWLEKTSAGQTQYHRSAPAEGFNPQSQCWLGIYKNHKTAASAGADRSERQ